MFARYRKIGVVIMLCMVVSTIAFADEKWVTLGKDVKYPLYVKGTYFEGSDNTEPRPQKSKYLEVSQAGIVVIKRGAGFYLNMIINKIPKKTLYIKIKYENPNDKNNPLVSDMVFTQEYGKFVFTSPDVIQGIVGSQNYLITVYIYENRNSKQPIDMLQQEVRAYIDTQTLEPLIYYNMRLNK